MSSKPIVISIINDTAAEVFDNLHKIMKQHNDKKDADKVVKYIIKLILKIGILSRNDQFSQQEINFLEQFSTKFQGLASSFITFYRDKSTYDKYYLQNTLEECRLLTQTIIERHLTAKSKSGINLVFNTLSEQDLLNAMFTNEAYKEHMDRTIDGMEKLKSQGYL